MSLKRALLRIYGVRSIYDIVNVCKRKWIKRYWSECRNPLKGIWYNSCYKTFFLCITEYQKSLLPWTTSRLVTTYKELFKIKRKTSNWNFSVQFPKDCLLYCRKCEYWLILMSGYVIPTNVSSRIVKITQPYTSQRQKQRFPLFIVLS